MLAQTVFGHNLSFNRAKNEANYFPVKKKSISLFLLWQQGVKMAVTQASLTLPCVYVDATISTFLVYKQTSQCLKTAWTFVIGNEIKLP